MIYKADFEDRAVQDLKEAIEDMEELQQQREYIMRAYEGDAVDIDGRELEDIDGRSQIRQTDVADTIEWVMPPLMSIFYGGHNIVELRPQGPNDEQAARLMQEKVNHDFTKGMDNGFNLFYDWFKDGLMNKLGAVKYWWEETETQKKEEYEELTPEEYAVYANKEDFEITDEEMVVAAEAVVDEFGVEISPEVVYYDIKGIQTTRHAGPKAEAIPPEEFVHNLTMKSIKEAEFVAHKKRVHKNTLAKYGIDPQEETTNASDQASDNLREERFEDIGGISYLDVDEDEDYVYIYECYMYDYDADGGRLPKKVIIYNDQILEVEDNSYGKPPFCILTSVRKQHRAVGYSIAEWVMELQKLNTALTRSILDGIYYQNNGVNVVNPYRINMDDVIDNNHPGASWRTQYDIDPSRCISPVQQKPHDAATFGMLETVQMWKENRTGITRYNQGLDSKSLNKTATGISQIMGAAQQRIELIARLYAETGVKDLFQAFVDMNLEYFDAEMNLKLNEEWQTINPESIDGKYDLSIDVGVGTGSNDIKINQLMQMMDRAPMGAEAGVVTPENLYQSMSSIYELMGFKNTQKYVTDPAKAGNQIPPEIVQAMMAMLSQNGVNVEELINAAAQSVQQGAAGDQGQGGPSTPNALPNG